MSDIETIKQRNPIEDVIQECGFDLGSKRGRYMRGRSQEYNSLVVNVADQFYFWNSKNEGGDVITWLQYREGLDFKTAVEYLCDRAKIPPPEWSQESNQERIAARAKEDALTVAARAFVKRYRQSDGAQKYTAKRGWSDETCRAAGIGFTGSNSAAEKKDLLGDFSMFQVDPKSNGARAALGIPAGMIIYPHVLAGRVRYLSARSIEGKKHYNLPRDLIGARHLYFNHQYHGRSAEIVVVEGQADAISLGQWEIPAIALAGVAIQDQADFLRELPDRHEVIYIGVDGDQAGAAALIGSDGDWPMAELFGAMARILRWQL